MAKAKIKRRAKTKITCGYCQEYSESKIIDGERICRAEAIQINKDKNIWMKKEVCPSFIPNTIFYCDRHGQRYDLKICDYRKKSTIHKKGLFLSFQKCRACQQHSIIKEILNKLKIKTPSVLKIKRRSKPKEIPKTIIPRREKIRRRDKPKTTIKRRRRN